MALTQSDWISPEQYLAEEALSEERNEYFDGLIYAMSGGTVAHSTLVLNFYAALRPHLKASPCRAHVTDMRLRVATANCYFYPDLLVHCDVVEAKTTTLESAKVIVEVLSPSTSSYDQGRKFNVYRQLESLQEYVLVESTERNVRVLRRGENGDWILHSFVGQEAIYLPSIDFSVSLTDLYDDTGIEE